MGKTKDLGFDKNGIRRVMRGCDYGADFLGQLGLGIMGNLVGQLQYFYTDKVGLAVGSVGIVMLITKIVDALTDIWFGNVIDHSKGGNRKYYKWMFRLSVPAAAIIILVFTVPIQLGQVPALLYALVTNLLFSTVIYTMIATPFAAAMVIRTSSQDERNNMGILRAVGNYGAGMIVAIITIPVTNMLGGNQSAWIKYGVIVALAVLLVLLICYNNGRKAKFAEDFQDAGTEIDQEEEKVPFKEAVSLLFHNKYWVIVLLFNLITAITNAIVGSAGTYYCKWIFGNDNLVALLGAAGMFATVLGFALSKIIISKLGVKWTVCAGLFIAVVAAGVRCFIPANLAVYFVTGLVGSFAQIPMMCLYGVMLGMAVDYNEYKYDRKLVAVSSGVIGFGNKVGSGVASVILAGFLALGAYDAAAEAATTSMRFAIYGFSNYLPVIINLVMFLIFRKFDLEEKLPAMRAEIQQRRTAR